MCGQVVSALHDAVPSVFAEVSSTADSVAAAVDDSSVDFLCAQAEARTLILNTRINLFKIDFVILCVLYVVNTVAQLDNIAGFKVNVLAV